MKIFSFFLPVAMVLFGVIIFSGESPANAEPTVSFIDGSDTWPAGFVSSCPEGCNYVSDTDDPLGPWSGQSVHFKGLEYSGQNLVYRYKLEFDQEVEIASIVISGAAWNMLRLLDDSMNELKQFDLPGGNELHTYTIHTFGSVGKTFYIEEINDGYTYFIYRSNIEVNFSQPCASEAEIILNGNDYSAISALRDEPPYPFIGWDIEGNSIYTWWDPVSNGGIDIWVEYEAELTKGEWNIGLCAINHSHLGHDGLGPDPDWYPQFELSNSLTDDIIVVPASDTNLNSGYFSFVVPADGLYTVKFRWLNDKAEGTRPDGMPILDANIKIARVFFDKNDDGCTYTPGYWKTHSIYGPAKYDDTWNGQEDSQFFNTGYTYYQIMHLPADEGAEYRLARQLIAAKLNMDNGASISIAVSASLTIGENFFMGAPLTRDEILDIAELLDDYNNGLTGPGACVEDEEIEEEEEEVE